MKTADHIKQLEDLKNELTKKEQEIEAMGSIGERMGERLEQLETDLAASENQVRHLEAEINHLQEKCKALEEAEQIQRKLIKMWA